MDIDATPPQLLSAADHHRPMESTEEVERISLFSRSEADILKLVFSIDYRAPPDYDTSFDVNALFSTAQSTIAAAIEVIDTIVGEGGPASTRSSVPSGDISLPKENIVGKMSCEAPGNEVAFESHTQYILTKLSYYPYEAQAVFAVAAFAPEFEEYSNSLQHAKPVTSVLLKHEGAVVEVNNLIKATLQVIEFIFELEKLISNDADSEPKLTMAIRDFPIYVYWSIITLVACATQLTTITASDEDSKPYDLSQFSEKINSNLDKIKGQLAVCRQEKEEVNAKNRFSELVNSAPREITKVFEILVLFKHIAYPQSPFVTIEPTNQEVFNIHMLEGKRVLFYISTLDNVCDQDISRLKNVYEEIEKNKEDFKILWIPIVEADWSKDGREEQFKEWRSKMPWYAVQYFSPPAIGYLKKEGCLKDKPRGVVLNPKGMLVTSHVIDSLPTEGVEALSYLKHDYLQMDAKAETRLTAQSAKVFERLVFPKGVKHALFRGSSNIPLDVHEELWSKNIFLFLSDVNISDSYIKTLLPIYEATWRQQSYRLVWVPIVQQWTEEKKAQFHARRAKMPWYTVKLFSAIADLRYMKEEWKFNGNPTLVVMDAQGNVDSTDAFPMIHKQGMKAFPFHTGEKTWAVRFTIA